MVFNALKRLFKPEYRIVFCRDCSTYHVQRRSLGGNWHYVTDDFFGIIATEFKYYSDAYMYVKKRHRLRKCRFSVLIHVNDCYLGENENWYYYSFPDPFRQPFNH